MTFRTGLKAGKTAMMRLLAAHCPRCLGANLTKPRPALKDGQPVPELRVQSCQDCGAAIWIAGPGV